METIRESIKADILNILDEVIKIMEDPEEKDVYLIKEQSNHTIHSASIFQDSSAISIAVLVYSLFKIMERGTIDKKGFRQIQEQLKYARLYLKEDDVHEYKRTLDRLFKIVSGLDERFKSFIDEVIEKAKINKGSKMYEHGISAGRAADLLGVSQWELASYIGKTTIDDVAESEKKIGVRKRIAIAKKVFGI